MRNEKKQERWGKRGTPSLSSRHKSLFEPLKEAWEKKKRRTLQKKKRGDKRTTLRVRTEAPVRGGKQKKKKVGRGDLKGRVPRKKKGEEWKSISFDRGGS